MMSNLRQYDIITTLLPAGTVLMGHYIDFKRKVNLYALLRARMRPDWSDSINPELCDTDTVYTVER